MHTPKIQSALKGANPQKGQTPTKIFQKTHYFPIKIQIKKKTSSASRK